MADTNDSDRTANWINERSRTDLHSEVSQVEVFTDTESETVTFAWSRPEDGETTTAWISAEADLVVNGSDMQ